MQLTMLRAAINAHPARVTAIRAAARMTAGPAGAAPAATASQPRSQGCYVGERVVVPGAPSGPLQGLTAVVKDSYDIAGQRTSNGSPAWREAHPPAAATAPAVQALLDAGATVLGKTVMDELAYSLQGENAHYGAPVNPACPGRVAGGSSSGAAAAVAAGDADIGLGGDTGGSVRVPASYCGVLGMRPTHGRVSLEGSCALAPSFDTAGWFARDAGVLRRAGTVLLAPRAGEAAPLRRWLVGTDAFALAEEGVAGAIYGALSAKIDAVKAVLGEPQEIEVGGGVEGGLEAWFEVFRIHQGHEAWAQHGAWITQQRPHLGPGIKERFEWAATISDADFRRAAGRRAAIRSHLDQLLGADGVLAVLSAPAAAPLLGQQEEDSRRRLITLTCIAGLGGLPQVSLPVAALDGCPLGLGLIGPRGSDEELLELAEQLMAALGHGS